MANYFGPTASLRGRGVALGAPKSDTSTSVVFLISRSRLQFAMRSWPEAVGIY